MYTILVASLNENVKLAKVIEEQLVKLGASFKTPQK
jgi:hypothetical protein